MIDTFISFAMTSKIHSRIFKLDISDITYKKNSISERWTLGFCSPTYLYHLVASLFTTCQQWKAIIYCLYMNLPSSKLSTSDSKLCIVSIWKINSAIGLQRTLLTRSQKSNLHPFTQQPEWLIFLMGKILFAQRICRIIPYFFLIYFVIGSKLLYDVMLVSAIQQCEQSLALCNDPGEERCRRKLNREGICM